MQPPCYYDHFSVLNKLKVQSFPYFTISMNRQPPCYYNHIFMLVSVHSHTWFHCSSSLENVFSSLSICVVGFFFSESSLPIIQLQFHQVLLVASLSLQAPQPVLEHPGNYHQQTLKMESSQDLNCSTKRKTLQGQQPRYLLTVEQH